jgi:UDP-N-acetylmuramate dehydrogenase
VRLSELTTLRVGGPAKAVTRVDSADAIVDAVRAADDAARPVLVLGGGSNLVVSDDGFPGEVVHVVSRGIDVVSDDTCAGVTVRLAAGEPWDAVVDHCVAQGWAGVECLSGIPGSAGATPIQNVGAYGQEIASTLATVRVWDRDTEALRTFANADCGFGYRTSRFKGTTRFVVLDLTLQLRIGEMSEPIRYAELAARLGVEVGARAPLAEVRAAVLDLRRGKGMVLEEADHDTWSAGSFFTNPVLPAELAATLPDAAPRWPQPDGTVKTSAAWLIEQAGFSKGYGRGVVTLSTKHTLAITNRGGASTASVLDLAAEIRDGVRDAFGVQLQPEPTLVGVTL